MSKSTFVRVLFIFVLLLAFTSIAIPAGATPPEDVSITLTSHYSFLDFGNPTGTWYSEGAITSSGDLDSVPKHFGAGWPHGIGFQTAHVVEVISDENGSITISTNAHGFEFTPDYDSAIHGEDCTEGYGEYYHGTGNWVILAGTGDYAKLHGQGKATLQGCVNWGALIMTTTGNYDGRVH